jgi:phosphoribosylglycinamide formyltransferase 2
MRIGSPLQPHSIRVLMLGSGELGKEVAIELMRLGVEVIACDRYADAPAMQVAHRSHVFDMLDAAALRQVIEREKPTLIVPEVEAIATAELVALEGEGWTVIPTAEATQLTMDREGIRRLAAEELGLATPKYRFADSFAELTRAATELGFPVVVKPIMSSSGKGQSVARGADELQAAWECSQTGGRSGQGRIIVEEFVRFDSEITLLTVRASNGTHMCDPVGHRQVSGDYVESWQPHPMSDAQLATAQDMARKVTDRLGGLGLFGVELFLHEDGRVIFSEVSPRPHDTGMVTMATQQWSEFALHARAIIGLPIQRIHRHSIGASVAVRSPSEIAEPVFEGVDQVFAEADVDLRIFGKPTARVKRRMAVILTTDENWERALSKGRAAAAKLEVTSA